MIVATPPASGVIVPWLSIAATSAWPELCRVVHRHCTVSGGIAEIPWSVSTRTAAWALHPASSTGLSTGRSSATIGFWMAFISFTSPSFPAAGSAACYLFRSACKSAAAKTLHVGARNTHDFRQECSWHIGNMIQDYSRHPTKSTCVLAANDGRYGQAGVKPDLCFGKGASSFSQEMMPILTWVINKKCR